MPERRVTLAAPPAFHLPSLGDPQNAWVAGEEAELRLESVYLDTVDLRLARWGASLRHRSDEGWTLRLPAGSGPPLLFEGSARRPPDAAVGLVRAFARRAPLQPMARLSTWRRVVPLVEDGGASLFDVVDDEVSILHGRRVAARFREVALAGPAVEHDSQSHVLEAVLTRLAAAGAAVTEAIPNHVRALGPIALVPEVAVPPLGDEPSAAEVITAAIAAGVVRLLRHDPGVRLAEDPEDVHQARVALRRLRSHLRTFGELLEAEWAERVRQEAGWLAAELGDVRDREVLLERLTTEIDGLAPADQRLAGVLTERLERELEEARAELWKAYGSDRYLDLVELLIDAARQPRLTQEADQPAADVLPALVRRPWNQLRRQVRELPDPAPDELLHRVRIRAKRVRYAAEAAALVAGPAAERFGKRAAGLQTVLGENQDSVVARDWIRDAAGTGRRGFVAGVLYGIEHAHGSEARAAWPGAWRKLAKRSQREWMG